MEEALVGGFCPTHDQFMLPMVLVLRDHASVPPQPWEGSQALGEAGGSWGLQTESASITYVCNSSTLHICGSCTGKAP